MGDGMLRLRRVSEEDKFLRKGIVRITWLQVVWVFSAFGVKRLGGGA